MRDPEAILSAIEELDLPPKANKAVRAILAELQGALELVRQKDRERQRRYRAGGGRKRKKKDVNGHEIAPTQEAQLFARGKQVLGDNAGGLIARLLKVKGTVARARAAIEAASERQDPKEYIGGILRNAQPSNIDPRLG